MRSVWLSMRDEDPPSGGLAELMAAARVKADQMKPTEPWWQRALAVLRRPPVLAMATVVLLVGGAVILKNRGGDELVVDQRAPMSAPALSQGSASTAKPEVVPDDLAAPPVVPTEAAPVKNKEKSRHRADKAGATKVAKAQSPEPDVVQTNGETKLGGGDLDEGQATTTSTTVPRQDPSPQVQVPGGGSRPTTVAELVKETQAAAARGDCPAVKTSAGRIKKLNPAVFDEQRTKNAAIAKCLE